MRVIERWTTQISNELRNFTTIKRIVVYYDYDYNSHQLPTQMIEIILNVQRNHNIADGYARIIQIIRNPLQIVLFKDIDANRLRQFESAQTTATTAANKMINFWYCRSGVSVYFW